MSNTVATAAVIRSRALSGALGVLTAEQDKSARAERGRLHKSLIALHAEKFPNETYATGAVTEKSVTIPVTKVNARGAVLKRPTEVTMSEFRRLSGTSTGRIGTEALNRAAKAFEAERDAAPVVEKPQAVAPVTK